MKDRANLFPIILTAAVLLFVPRPAQADQYQGNGDIGFGGVIGNGTLTLSDDGTNISGTLTVGGSMNDVLVLYIQSDTGGFTTTSGFNDQGDSCRQAISGVSASGRSLLTFASGFQPNYAIALAPAAAGTGGLWQLANGTNNSLVYMGSVNLAPLNNTGPYTFSFPAALFGMIPGVRSTIQVFGTYVRTDGSRSTEAIAGNLTGTQGWQPFAQKAVGSYTFDAGAVLVKLPLGIWAQRSGTSVAERENHTAVWTGSEMIVWGGWDGSVTRFNNGGRFDPAANVWTALPTAAAPSARYNHTAVWAGSEMIVWGGCVSAGTSGYFNDGGRYNPIANSWTAVSTNGAPVGRCQHTAVWTGGEMIVWGGVGASGYANDGGRYDPVANTWTALPGSGAPAGRCQHTAVWTGSEMIVWGGYNGGYSGYFNDGGRYDPGADGWIALSTSGAPAARTFHTAVWTGSEMLVWGGYSVSGGYFNTGGRYDPEANSWTAIATNGAPGGRYQHAAVWTGNDMIAWGGLDFYSTLNDGGRYNPSSDTWTAMPTSGAPGKRCKHTAVWTGTEMIVWGGDCGCSDICLNDGGRYNPAANSWTTLATGREMHTAVWTGTELIIWGGWAGTMYLNDGGRYSPAANSWTAMTTTGAPAARYGHTAVWTGSEMLVWGGYSNRTFYANGERYNPALDSWTGVATSGAPAARYLHTAVWTGSEMIIWGGLYQSGASYYCLNDGGRYNPTLNSWAAVTTTGAPAGRYSHTAVWTGSQMIVWGGARRAGSIAYYADGGRYNPAANSWTVLPATGAPAGRSQHTAVWTGSEMILWGGYSNSTYYADGGRYNPAANGWTAVPSSGAPAARSSHTAVWTGGEMIVWGGDNGGALNSGGRYNPAANSWTALPFSGAPTERYGHTAVWTGTEMIIFGGNGYGAGYLSGTWSYYPYAPAVRITRFSPISGEVAWPVCSSSLRLCQTTNLPAGPWTTLTNTVTQVGAENHVTVSPLSGGQFFRAVYP
jgi:N-acetylneuraminic acid mutarotase